jgi:hypothetical protein
MGYTAKKFPPSVGRRYLSLNVSKSLDFAAESIQNFADEF